MSISFEMLLVTSAVGALQSFFFGIYLFTLKKGKSIANVLLAILLLAFAVRIIKSVGYYFSEGHVIPNLLMNLGFGCNLAILPLLWLYLNAFLKNDYQYSWKRDTFHLLPAIVTILLSPVLTDYFWLQQYGYLASLLSMLAYLPFCVLILVKHFKNLSGVQRLWLTSLIAGITTVWLGYLANFVFGLVPYILAPVLFSVLIYFLSFLALKQASLVNRESRYLNSGHSHEQLNQCHTELMNLFSNSKPFKDSSLTLSKLAAQLHVSPNLLSETINKKIGYNFPDFINSHRIREAQALLEMPNAGHQKIATIAFETGFNSLSVFNAAFKKFTSVTPSTYRKKLSEQ